MKKTFTYIFAVLLFAFASAPMSASAYSYVNTGYQYTDYNNGAVNYYNHQYTPYRTSYNSYTYPVYYPQYYPVYYTVPQQPTCYDYYYSSGPYYESPEYTSYCSDRVEDYANRMNKPNQFLTEMSYATGSYYNNY